MHMIIYPYLADNLALFHNNRFKYIPKSSNFTTEIVNLWSIIIIIGTRRVSKRGNITVTWTRKRRATRTLPLTTRGPGSSVTSLTLPSVSFILASCHVPGAAVTRKKCFPDFSLGLRIIISRINRERSFYFLCIMRAK